MYHYCKLCGECLLLICYEFIGEWTTADKLGHYKCHLCPEYFLVYSTFCKRILQETVRVKNFNAAFASAKKAIHIFKDEDNHTWNGKGALEIIPTNELTHELAIQWVKRLKTCVTFQ